MLLVSGCIQPVQKLGCCVKQNISQGCLLYNMSKASTDPHDLINLFGKTNQKPCVDGNCNVTIDGKDTLIPICSDDDLLSCVSQECKAMVCGDFKFSPPIGGPSFSTAQEAEKMPPENDEKAILQLYNAQCRFLPMDQSLKRIMKNTKSSLNIFRFGVGDTFSAYDQYSGYFPISDKFCGQNQKGRIDRFANYFSSDLQPYSPSTEIQDGCLDSSTDLKPPFSTDALGSTAPGYKFDQYLRKIEQFYDVLYDENKHTTGYSTSFDYIAPYERLDKEGYMSALNKIYLRERTNNSASRARFECDASGNDCYSGTCDTFTYNRVNLVDNDGKEVGGLLCTRVEYKYLEGKRFTVCEASPVDVVYAAKTAKEREWRVAHHCQFIDPSAFVVGSCDKDGQFIFPSESAGCDSEMPEFTYDDYKDYIKPVYPAMKVEAVRFSETPQDFLPGNDINTLAGVSDNLMNTLHDAAACEARARAECEYTAYAGGWDQDRIDQCVDDKVDRICNAVRGYSWVGSTFDIEPTSGGFPKKTKTISSIPKDFEVTDDGNLSITENGTGWPPASSIILFNNAVGASGNGCFDVPTMFTTAAHPGIAGCDDNKGIDVYGFAMMDESAFKQTSFYKQCGLDASDYARWPITYQIDVGDDTFVYNEDVFAGNRDSLENVLISGGVDISALSVKPYGYELCGQMDDTDAAVAGDPLFIAFEKSGSGVSSSGTYYGNPFIRDLVRKNFFGQTKGSGSPTEATSCALKKIMNTDSGNKLVNYTILVPQEVIAIKSLGRCNVTAQKDTQNPDITRYVPTTRIYGWCQSCSTAMMAQQTISRTTKPYAPISEIKTDTLGTPTESDNVPYYPEPENGEVTSGICQGISDASGNPPTVPTCFNPYISDIAIYNTKGYAITENGSPSTYPEASYVKERMGDYLKAGVMPVLDMSQASNWDKTNYANAGATPPDFGWFGGGFGGIGGGGGGIFGGGGGSATGEGMTGFLKYDSSYTVDDMGAIVVITGKVDASLLGESDASMLDIAKTIKQRNRALKTEICPNCLAAIKITGPNDLDTHRMILERLFGGESCYTSGVFTGGCDAGLTENPYSGIDIIAFDYSPNTEFASYSPFPSEPENKSKLLISSMQNYSLMGLKKYAKPSLITNFSIIEDPDWTEADFNAVFKALFTSQDQFVRSGLIGIIFSDMYTSGSSGLINADEGFSKRFCALGNQSSWVTTASSISVFNKVLTSKNKTCEPCDSLDTTLGQCSKICADGVECQPPATTGRWKCPDGRIPESCSPCTETGYTYTCTRKYANGTVFTFDVTSAEMGSDAYAEVMAGLQAPYKCCIRTASGNYSYTQTRQTTQTSTPIAFSTRADPNLDCGIASISTIRDVQSFCGLQLPINDYTITCHPKNANPIDETPTTDDTISKCPSIDARCDMDKDCIVDAPAGTDWCIKDSTTGKCTYTDTDNNGICDAIDHGQAAAGDCDPKPPPVIVIIN